MIYDVAIEGKTHRLDIRHEDGHWHCQLDRRAFEINAVLTRPDVLSILIDGKAYEIKRERDPVGTHIWVGSARYGVELSDPRSLRSRKIGAAGEAGPRKLLAPMPGKVVRVLAPEKAAVEAGQGVVVMEAMKMQNEIKSPKKGIVQKILAAEGTSVSAGDVLAIVE